jgi:NodT family efflux transporter outer membrane factor (OMF) lipoprotein
VYWWREFHDATLDALVAKALAQNLTLRQAGLRVLESRARRGISVGEFFPQVQAASGQIGNHHTSKNAPLGSADRSYNDASIGIDVVWELDFWGKFRRGIESADAALEASVAEYDSVLVALVAEVAATYVRIRSLEERVGFTRANVQSQQDTLTLTQARFAAGAVSELDVATARATVANTRSLVPQLEDGLRQAKLSLCVLLGRTPSDLDAELRGPPGSTGGTVPAPPPMIAAGVPADLLRRRPEVRRAEREAQALCAQIGVTKADLYPSVSITGSTGFRAATFHTASGSPSLGNLFDADSFEGFVGLGFNWPILNYGRITNDVRAADARYQQAIVAYQNTVLQAAADVETGLSLFLRAREQADLLAESVTAAQRAAELARIQYERGAVDFLRVNQAQVDLVDRQNSLVVARAGAAQGAIATYKALGGGWEAHRGELLPRETIEQMRARTDWGDLLDPAYAQGADFAVFPRPATDTSSPTGQTRQ